ncbi:MAG: glycosyltransferase [Chloroflexi bacterium]|nr:glycosyltransferase [Chloroflexota bacterium]
MIALNDLPPPPPGKTGWLWTRASAPARADVPRLSIITPSFNQARTLEETIRSVLLQSYPNLEYIVIDGGSTDGSVEIIRQYAPFLTRWVSEKDRGQSDALNKGFMRATGDIVAWINSDDRYLPNAFAAIAAAFAHHPDAGLVCGNLELILDHTARVIGYSVPPARMLAEMVLPFQPTCFFRRARLNQIALVDVAFKYVMDVDLLLKVMTNAEFVVLPRALASFRIQGASKTNTAEAAFARELLILLERVRAQRHMYPAWRALSDNQVRCLFYRRASKHFYMGDQFAASLNFIARAIQAHPRATFSIAGDEGIGWLARRCVPAKWYRSISAVARAVKSV